MNEMAGLPDANALLRRDFGMLIGGELRPAADGATLESINPATGEALAKVPNAGSADIDRAVRAAKAAYAEWSAKPFLERHGIVLSLTRILREHADEFGLLDTLDTGNVYSGMRRDAAGGAEMIEYFAAAAHEIKGEVTHLDSNLHYTRREPYGVVARLLPFNHPIASFATALAAPLLTGNCVVMKPSPHSPLSALLFGELARAHVPPGVLNIVTGENDRASAPLIGHPGINRIGLIGSVDAGRTVMRLAAERLVPLSLELGGKNPLIIFPDADIQQAVDIAIAGMNFLWQGHSCGSTSRILVHASLEKRFVDALAERVGRIRVAMPTDPAAEMGAISFKALYERCQYYLTAGRQDGARLVVGGERPRDPAMSRGLFMTPAVFADAEPHMRVAQEEIFGPIMTVLSWDDYDRMLEVANGLHYGLTAVLVTDDLHVAHRTAEALQAGYIEVNGPVGFALGSPFGGFKQSGIGREGSFDELLGYTQIKSINVRLKPGKAVSAELSGTSRQGAA
jgi:acyl-CoA reductase-like NAD-dependent aldehyde dehydrogenase